MTVVIDSGILLASVLVDEPVHKQAVSQLTLWAHAGETLAAPRLIRSEVTAVLRRAVYQKRISHDVGQQFLTKLLNTPVTLYDDDPLLQRAYALAYRFNLPRAYDSQYLALAERLNCTFWSADERLVNAVQPHFSNIQWLGQFKPPTP